MSQEQEFRVPSPPVAPPPSMNGHHASAAPAAAVSVALPPTVASQAGVSQAGAPRRWTPKGLAVVVIVIVLGGLGVMVGLQRLVQRDTVLVVAKAVPVGSRVSGADLTMANISSDAAIQTISGADRGQVLGKVALVDLRPGTTLTQSELGTSDGFTSGQVLVPLPLKQGELPARGLAPGQKIIVVATVGAAGSSSSSSASTPTGGTNATVTEVGSPDASSGVRVVDVRVPAAAAVTLAQVAATGNLTVLLLPPGR